MKQKRFVPGIPTHNYQKGVRGNLLFYSVLDRLVYFTLFCTEATRHHVTVLSLNLMMTHTHALISTESKVRQTAFNHTVERLYARSFNQVSGLNGPVFMKTYGWAQKRNSAKVRSCLAYIGNNHVEKKICRRGIEERWSLLAYAFSDHPFSEPLVIRRASVRMKKAVKMVQDAHRRGQFLNGSREKMIAAFDTTTGSEYELTEDDEPEPDTAYIEMLRFLKKKGYDLVAKDFLRLTERDKRKLMQELTRNTTASIRQASRLLRLPFPQKKHHQTAQAGPFPSPVGDEPFFIIPFNSGDYVF